MNLGELFEWSLPGWSSYRTELKPSRAAIVHLSFQHHIVKLIDHSSAPGEHEGFARRRLT